MARYFVHLTPDGSPAHFWRPAGNFAGLTFHYNFNLLARAVGDDPTATLPAWADLVAPQEYDFGEGTVKIQPFAYSPQGGNANRPEGLPIGQNLNRFLNDPLLGERLELSLPFYDEEVKLGPAGGGFFRKENDATAFHGGTDFNKRPRATFEVCAAAPGRVLARDGENGQHGGTMVLAHLTPAGKEYRTLYQHLDITTVPRDLTIGVPVRRGQYLGQAIDVSIIHLHFGVAAQGPSTRISGVVIPALWYFIDPWGIYDYYEHDSRSHGSYLPPENLPDIYRSRIVGALHTIHWRSQPLHETLPIVRQTESYAQIEQIQFRGWNTEVKLGIPAREQGQFCLWLKSDPDPFLVPSLQTAGRSSESALTSILQEAFLHSKPVKLEYHYEGQVRHILSAWIKA